MFKKKYSEEEVRDTVGSYRRDLEDCRTSRESERLIAETKFNNMVLEKDAEIRLAEQNATARMQYKLTETERKLAVTEKENEMLKAVNELDGDVLDVKDLVTKLIDKLPEINVNSLVVGTQETNKTK